MADASFRGIALGVGLVGIGAGIALLVRNRVLAAPSRPTPKFYPAPASRVAMPSTPPPSSSSSPGSSVPPAPLAQGVARTFGTLLGQINQQWPNRKKGADGMLPSDAHRLANPTSDHDKGNALDVTYDPANGPNLDDLAEALMKDPRVTYVIWNRRIANRAIEGGIWRPYLLTAIQTDPHTGHLHLSIAATTRDDTSPWDLSSVSDSATIA